MDQPAGDLSRGAVAGGAVVTVGADGTTSGERDDGGTTRPNTAPNTYVVSEGAGLGIISGTLWDDTLTPTTSTAPDGTRIAGQTVTFDLGRRRWRPGDDWG